MNLVRALLTACLILALGFSALADEPDVKISINNIDQFVDLKDRYVCFLYGDAGPTLGKIDKDKLMGSTWGQFDFTSIEKRISRIGWELRKLRRSRPNRRTLAVIQGRQRERTSLTQLLAEAKLKRRGCARLDPGAAGTPKSRIGSNLCAPSPESPEFAFLNLFKSSGDWISCTGATCPDGREIATDSSGWVTSLEAGQSVRSVIFSDLAYKVPGGLYTLLYDGEGSIDFEGARRVSYLAQPGREVAEFDSSSSSFVVIINGTNPANYIRNIRILPPGGTCENNSLHPCYADGDCGNYRCISYVNTYQGQTFHPLFLRSIREYGALRFSEWQRTVEYPWTSWEQRPKTTDARYSRGVPIEVMVELANLAKKYPWFSISHLADDNAVASFATLVRDSLSPDLRVYIEHSSRVWNVRSDTHSYAVTQGTSLGLSSDGYQAARRYHSRRSVQIFRIWKQIYGGTDRLLRVLSVSNASNQAITDVVDYNNAHKEADAISIPAYFGETLGAPGVSDSVAGWTVDALMTHIEANEIPALKSRIGVARTIAKNRSLKLIASEGGQHLAGIDGGELNPALVNLFAAANADSRMRTAYLTMLADWDTVSGNVFFHYVNTDRPKNTGSWGALTNLLNQSGPKYDAILQHIYENY